MLSDLDAVSKWKIEKLVRSSFDIYLNFIQILNKTKCKVYNICSLFSDNIRAIFREVCS